MIHYFEDLHQLLKDHLNVRIQREDIDLCSSCVTTFYKDKLYRCTYYYTGGYSELTLMKRVKKITGHIFKKIEYDWKDMIEFQSNKRVKFEYNDETISEISLAYNYLQQAFPAALINDDEKIFQMQLRIEDHIKATKDIVNI